jgi:hypothetical protein
MMFVLGVMLGIIGVAGGLLLASSGSFSPIKICVGELVTFLLLLFVVMKVKRPGLLQGFLTGVALVFLLCAACYGLMMGVSGHS